MSSGTPRPKRHHFWPEVQSRHWTQPDGLVCATRRDGSYFRTSPGNIGVESNLYTRYGVDGTKNDDIEAWLATEIDSSFPSIAKHVLDPSNTSRRSFRGDPRKAETLRQLGYLVRPYVEDIALPAGIRSAIARYVAALLVRNPVYLEKLVAFHATPGDAKTRARDAALDNMLWLHELYVQKISASVYILSKREASHEFLYTDGGLSVDEPWRSENALPFDIFVPLTPDLSISVLPLPNADDLNRMSVAGCTNNGIDRLNRIALSTADRFVFSRKLPPVAFIKKYFGVSAPKNIGFRFVNGRLETRYEPHRR